MPLDTNKNYTKLSLSPEILQIVDLGENICRLYIKILHWIEDIYW